MPPFPSATTTTSAAGRCHPHQQHPVRGTFLDPRPDPDLGAIYHTGVDVAVRDDKPEAGALPGRTHRVFAIEGGVVEEATKPGVRGNVRIGHFGDGHVDARVKKGDRVSAGQFIGWTTKGSWHVHLTEFHFPGDGRRLLLTRSGPAGSSSPTSTRRRRSSTTSASTPRDADWGRRVTGVAQLPPAGQRLDKSRLTGIVDIERASAIRSRSSAGSATSLSSPRPTTRTGSASC